MITMTLTHSGNLIITVGQKTLDDLMVGLPQHVYPIFDLYGKCERVSIVNMDIRNGTPINEEASLQTVNETCLGTERNVPHGEKGDLEVHEKETDVSLPSSSAMTGSTIM